MNRLSLQPPDFEIGLGSARIGVVQPPASRADRGSAYALVAPLHYEPNYAYPVVVWLHGPGEDEQQIKRIMPLVSMRNYLSVAPRGTVALTTAVGSPPAYAWSQSPDHQAQAEQRVLDAIEAAGSRFHISRRRVFLAGFDSGGTMALRLAMSLPGRFAGVLSLGGGFPSGHNPLGRYAEARRVPLFVACGQDSQRYPLDRVCEDLRLYHSAGMVVSLRVYPCGDEICPHMLPDMDRWMMEQIASSKQLADA